MHCPRCGQQQVSNETRFCSRCGFPLSLVTEILANGGVLPQLAELHGKENQKFLTRKNGLKFALAWFLVWTFLFTPILAVLNLDRIVPIAAVFGTMGGLLLMLFSLMFLEGQKKVWQPEMVPQQGNFIGGNVNPTALPPQQSYPIQDFVPPAGSWKAPDTSEFARPGSVTEETTKLLQKED